MNTWPKGYKYAMAQSEHESWNAKNYPGTRQLCYKCDEPTGRCENDSLLDDSEDGPLCEDCRSASMDIIKNIDRRNP